jgi:hypothetical protein
MSYALPGFVRALMSLLRLTIMIVSSTLLVAFP